MYLFGINGLILNVPAALPILRAKGKGEKVGGKLGVTCSGKIVLDRTISLVTQPSSLCILRFVLHRSGWESSVCVESNNVIANREPFPFAS